MTANSILLLVIFIVGSIIFQYILNRAIVLYLYELFLALLNM